MDDALLGDPTITLRPNSPISFPPCPCFGGPLPCRRLDFPFFCYFYTSSDARTHIAPHKRFCVGQSTVIRCTTPLQKQATTHHPPACSFCSRSFSSQSIDTETSIKKTVRKGYINFPRFPPGSPPLRIYLPGFFLFS